MIYEDKSDNEGSRAEKAASHVEPFSFSALHFLRNRLHAMPTDLAQSYGFPSHMNGFANQTLPPLESILPLAKLSMQSRMSSGSEFSSNSPTIFVKSPTISPNSIKSPLSMSGAPQSVFCGSFLRRPRGEKRPIPEEQKDEKYFERRKRNNEAAKKSRDARKMREDRIALRAAILEQENSLLRAQTIALREEVCTLRQILCNSRALSSGLSTIPQV